MRNFSNGDHLGWPVIAAAPNDNVWVLGCSGTGSDNYVYAWLPQTASWQQIPNAAGTSISVSADGTPWLINSAHSVYEYVSTWQPMGPRGFSFTDENGVGQTWAGEVHDIDATPSSGVVTMAATSGGVWQNVFGWVPISDVGAGLGSGGSPSSGPVNSTGTLAVKPSDQNTVVVATGVAGDVNGPNSDGNGIWVTHSANASPVSWAQATIYDQSGSVVLPGTAVYPKTFAKVRYSADGSKIYALSSQAPFESSTQALYLSIDDGASFRQSTDSNCAAGVAADGTSDVFTDLVVDPNNSAITYLGVAGEGVWQGTWNGPGAGAITCSHGIAPKLFTGTPDTITSVALTISGNSLLYAAFAGLPGTFNNDFENIDATTTGTWGQPWSEVIRPDSPLLVCDKPCLSGWGLDSQNACQPSQKGCGHNWAIGTDPSGTIILLGAKGLWRGTSCGQNGCVSFNQISPAGGPYQTGHEDHHSIVWASNGWVYVANDGGLFYSTDSGATWNNQTNTFGVANETNVDVGPGGGSVYATAWDIGGHYSLDNGASWTSFHGTGGPDGNNLGLDTFQAIASQAYPGWAFICASGNRESYDTITSTWTNIDHSSPPVEEGACRMAFGGTGPLFTTGTSNPNIFFTNTFDDPNSWVQYQANLPSIPWSVFASNESTPSVYAITGTNQLNISITGGSWRPPITPPWPTGDGFGGNGSAAGAVFAIDRATSDLYTVGVSNPTTDQIAPVVLKSLASAHGLRWSLLTGTVTPAPATPGKLKQDEVVKAIYPDSSSRAVIVGTDGTAAASSVYGAATVWRLNNSDVSDSSHHWRPWVNGLPAGTQPIAWITGTYGDDGVYYYYIATWGRGIWKREARGGDF